METLQAILTRRSIRNFTGEAISDEQLHHIIESGMYAPSANNRQPWHFVVIDDRMLLDQIPGFHPYAAMVKEASVVISVCGDTRLEPAEGYLALDCGAAAQNMMLAAHELGLGSCWLGIYPRKQRMEAVTELLEFPDHILPMALIVLGVPNEIKSTPNRFRPDRIYSNRWPWPEPETGRI
ncbi:MAG: nitroreductase family protein [Acidobacteria bacterium]|nr:nitroreductase family protein [Acidobacteriota bacterium]